MSMMFVAYHNCEQKPSIGLHFFGAFAQNQPNGKQICGQNEQKIDMQFEAERAKIVGRNLGQNRDGIGGK